MFIYIDLPSSSPHHDSNFDSNGEINAKIVQDRKYILGDSYLCLDGDYIFLISTMHHLYEPEDLFIYDNIFFIWRNHHYSNAKAFTFLFTVLLSIFLIKTKHLACIASLQLDILPFIHLL